MARNLIQRIPVPGRLVSLGPVGRRGLYLDGFWARGQSCQATLLLIVHGMGGNFYRSILKQTLMRKGLRNGCDVLSFNNRGCERRVEDERFGDCMADIGAAVAFAQAQGYRRLVLFGHSTGCQKITCFQARCRHPDIAALILAAPCDDAAISRRDLGALYGKWLLRARRLVATGQSSSRLSAQGLNFSARRFLSAADPSQPEAAIFNYDGPMRLFRRIDRPILVLFGDREEYAVIPPLAMCDRLRGCTRSSRFEAVIIPGADHGFHGCETQAATLTYHWLTRL